MSDGPFRDTVTKADSRRTMTRRPFGSTPKFRSRHAADTLDISML